MSSRKDLWNNSRQKFNGCLPLELLKADRGPYQNVNKESTVNYGVRFHGIMSKFCPSLNLRFVHSHKKFEHYVGSPDQVFAN